MLARTGFRARSALPQNNASGEAVARLPLLESSRLIEPTDFPRASMFALQHFAIIIERCILEFCLDRSLELCPLYRTDFVATSLYQL